MRFNIWTSSAIMLIILALISGIGCESSDHDEDGEHDANRELTGHLPSHEEGGGEGEESAQQFAKNETYDKVRHGARLILSYDANTNTFTGTVENTTNQTLSKVRVEVHLSNGIELGPTAPNDLAPGQKVNVELNAAGQNFSKWSAHPEVGSGEHGGGEGHDEGGEHD